MRLVMQSSKLELNMDLQTYHWIRNFQGLTSPESIHLLINVSLLAQNVI